jgi:hypothetical protein
MVFIIDLSAKKKKPIEKDSGNDIRFLDYRRGIAQKSTGEAIV